MLRTAVVLVVIGVLASAPSSTGTTTGPGLIAFTQYRLQDSPLWSEIWVTRADGSQPMKVSHSARAVEDDGAQWSPLGDLITFQRCPPRGAACSVWVVRPDGSGQHVVARCPTVRNCNDGNPSFAPDGKHVVWVRDWGHVKQGAIPDDEQIDHSAIVETDLSGRHLRILRRADGYTGGFASPRVSPDGTMLLFDHYAWSRKRLAPDVLSIAPVRGGAAHRVLPAGMQAQSGSWSPDGKTVLFRPSHPGVDELAPGSNLFIVAADGTNLRRVTSVGGSHYVIAGSFSPDGQSIVYATDLGATLNPRGNTFADIFTLPLGGGATQQVTHTANLDGWPSWGNAS